MTDDAYLNLAYEFYIGRNVKANKEKALRFAKIAAVLSYRSFAANQSCEVSKAKFFKALQYLQYISTCISPSRSAICTNESKYRPHQRTTTIVTFLKPLTISRYHWPPAYIARRRSVSRDRPEEPPPPAHTPRVHTIYLVEGLTTI